MASNFSFTSVQEDEKNRIPEFNYFGKSGSCSDIDMIKKYFSKIIYYLGGFRLFLE